jgi:hypothetical protein
MPEILKKEETIIKIKGEAEGFVVEARITNGELQGFSSDRLLGHHFDS